MKKSNRMCIRLLFSILERQARFELVTLSLGS